MFVPCDQRPIVVEDDHPFDACGTALFVREFFLAGGHVPKCDFGVFIDG